MLFASPVRHRMVFCLAVLLLMAPLFGTGEAARLDPAGTSLYSFGLHLFQLGEYYRAITELKRFSLLFPRHQRQPAAYVLIGLALQENGRYDAAMVYFQGLRQRHKAADVDRIAAFKLGELRFVQQQYDQAVKHFQHFLNAFPDGPLAHRTTYLLGLSWALTQRPHQAQQVLKTLSPHHPFFDQALALRHELSPTMPSAPKSPRLAGTLGGILPGAGHLYLGKPRHALTAFLLNGLFITGAVYALLEGLEAVTAILLYFETGWYLGNINSAVEGAREINLRHRQARHDYLRTTYAPPGLTLRQMQMPSLGLRLTF
ncbi:MAG: tetratricopeptide repeat protein [Candidatus Tectomicrobia bacterium]